MSFLRATRDDEMGKIGPSPSGCGENRSILRSRPRRWTRHSLRTPPRLDRFSNTWLCWLASDSYCCTKEIKEALGFDAWQETLESALGAESDSAEAHDAAEDEVEDDDEDQVPPVPAVAVAQCAPAPLAGGPEAFLRADDNADDTPHPDQKFPPDRLRAIATAAFAKVLTAAARDEARDKITTRSAAEKKAPTIPDRPTGAILRSPGCGEGAEQRIEVTLGEGWGLHQPP